MENYSIPDFKQISNDVILVVLENMQNGCLFKTPDGMLELVKNSKYDSLKVITDKRQLGYYLNQNDAVFAELGIVHELRHLGSYKYQSTHVFYEKDIAPDVLEAEADKFYGTVIEPLEQQAKARRYERYYKNKNNKTASTAQAENRVETVTSSATKEDLFNARVAKLKQLLGLDNQYTNVIDAVNITIARDDLLLLTEVLLGKASGSIKISVKQEHDSNYIKGGD